MSFVKLTIQSNKASMMKHSNSSSALATQKQKDKLDCKQPWLD